MFLIGCLLFVTLLPLVWWKMPESVVWLVSRGRLDEARRIAEETGVEMPAAVALEEEQGAVGYRGLFGDFLAPALMIGLMSATGLLLVYSLNTWLLELILRAGFNARGSLSFLLMLNGAAALGPILVARFADRFGPKPVVAASFLLGALAIAELTLKLPLPALLALVALVGVGASGTQTLIYGFVANYFPTRVRGAGVAWCAGFGRLGGVGGPLIGGLLIAVGLSIEAILCILAGLALVGLALTLIVPATSAASRAMPSLARSPGRAGGTLAVVRHPGPIERAKLCGGIDGDQPPKWEHLTE
jgi:AAHS family benzoate transporter-like MFS transporter